jgi:hypothetical protein
LALLSRVVLLPDIALLLDVVLLRITVALVALGVGVGRTVLLEFSDVSLEFERD